MKSTSVKFIAAIIVALGLLASVIGAEGKGHWYATGGTGSDVDACEGSLGDSGDNGFCGGYCAHTNMWECEECAECQSSECEVGASEEREGFHHPCDLETASTPISGANEYVCPSGCY